MKKIRIAFTGIIASVILSGCVTTGEFEQMKSDIARLYVENNQLKQEISELKTRVDKMSSDLSSAVALKEGQLTLLAQTQDYVKELQILKGRFEENSFQNEKKFKELSDKIAELQAKLTQPAQPSEKQQPAKAPEEQLKDPKAIYDSAHIDMKNKKFASAREKFQEIIKNYPDFELLPNSYFWIGETYYNEKKYEDAILAYEEFLKRYPKHEKAPGALLKEGMAFVELKDKKTAKVVFERVIERYPQSKEAEIAQQKIAEILKSWNSDKKPTKKVKSKTKR
ncbi:MAG: tol-pal system protein YbgF [Thermodesulfovibrio sp.]|jgi:tol-pal system protein YbgF|uniref:Tol-pal system protein YbgF n=2 Tax=Thermodesulfovibrio TaxID=28261 RepID=A0A2J6WIW1_9BACT|nr:MAG: tol-pal system protein YbgF [Thermodesulfovibrio aggregans]